MSSKTTTAADKHKLKEMIERFYAIANKKPQLGLQINDRVAEVFMKMLQEADKCTQSVAYVPLPLSSKITKGGSIVTWMATYISGLVFNSFSKKLNSACVNKVLSNWSTEMELANLGL